MKKFMLAMLFAGITLFATASTELKNVQVKTTTVKKTTNSLIVWEINFTCNGTPGTMCCFDTEAQAQAFINSHSAQWFCDYVNQP